MVICVRLNPDEVRKLERLSKREGIENRSEVLRLLVLREYSRSAVGRSAIKGAEYATAFRNGRPRQSVMQFVPSGKV